MSYYTRIICSECRFVLMHCTCGDKYVKAMLEYLSQETGIQKPSVTTTTTSLYTTKGE